jgi:hypothetical protein
MAERFYLRLVPLVQSGSDGAVVSASDFNFNGPLSLVIRNFLQYFDIQPVWRQQNPIWGEYFPSSSFFDNVLNSAFVMRDFRCTPRSTRKHKIEFG